MILTHQLRGEYQLAQHAPVGYIGAAKAIIDPRVPKNFAAIIKDPIWAADIDKELTKFEVNLCLHAVPDTGQHKVPMYANGPPCGTGRSNDNVHRIRSQRYCGNVSACGNEEAELGSVTVDLG
jgi:hypothetical protein